MNPKEYLAISDAYKKVYATEDELQEKKKDKDTPDQVKAVIAYDKARKGTDDATYDSEHGDKKQAKKERDYAKWQRDQGAEFAQKSGHRWKHAPGSTREKEGEKSVKHAEVKDSYQPLTSRDQQGLSDAYRAVYGEDRKYGYDKAGNSLNPVDIEKRKRKEDDLFGSPKSHNKSTSQGQRMGGKSTIYKEESQAKQEISDLKKAAKTLKGKYVAKADKVEEGIVKESGWHRRNPEKVGTPADPDTPVLKGSGKVKTYAQTKKENPPSDPTRGGIYKPDKDGKMVRVEDKNWIQGAVKRPGAFTKKAKSHDMGVQQFAKYVDDNPKKFDTRTKRQANLAQTFASMKKEDMDEMIEILGEVFLEG